MHPYQAPVTILGQEVSSILFPQSSPQDPYQFLEFSQDLISLPLVRPPEILASNSPRLFGPHLLPTQGYSPQNQPNL